MPPNRALAAIGCWDCGARFGETSPGCDRNCGSVGAQAGADALAEGDGWAWAHRPIHYSEAGPEAPLPPVGIESVCGRGRGSGSIGVTSDWRAVTCTRCCNWLARAFPPDDATDRPSALREAAAGGSSP